MLEATAPFSHGLSGLGAPPLRATPLFSVKSCDPRTETERLVACSNEELGRLRRILQDLGGHATVRGSDGSEVPVTATAGKAPACALAAEWMPSAPIYDATGKFLAMLEVGATGIDRSNLSAKLLVALVNSVAQSISERWFRISYRPHWIIAALRRDGMEEFITLAVDRQYRVLGADHGARERLKASGRRMDSQLSLSAFFQFGTVPLRGRRFGDAAMTLIGRDGVAWNVLITPPDYSADLTGHSQRVLLHARPRLATLARIDFPLTPEESGIGLPPRMYRRVNEYIDAHLDSALDIPELAQTLSMSESHFARCFRNSSGFTPHNYVMRRRLRRAEELLVQTDLPLIDIALATGFADQSHFSRRFHELTGLGPRAFRAQHR
jgi:AraC-like DNA-binding protein